MASSCKGGSGLVEERFSHVSPVDEEVTGRSFGALFGFDSAVLLVDKERFREMDGLIVTGLSSTATVLVSVIFLRLVAFAEMLDVDAVFAPLRRVATMLLCCFAGLMYSQASVR